MSRAAGHGEDAAGHVPSPGGPDGASVLDVRYRRLLRVLPPAYRAAREDEMVATFLAAE